VSGEFDLAECRDIDLLSGDIDLVGDRDYDNSDGHY